MTEISFVYLQKMNYFSKLEGRSSKGDGRKKVWRVILVGVCLNGSKSGSNGLRDLGWVRGHMKSRLGSTFDTSFWQWQA